MSWICPLSSCKGKELSAMGLRTASMSTSDRWSRKYADSESVIRRAPSRAPARLHEMTGYQSSWDIHPSHRSRYRSWLVLGARAFAEDTAVVRCQWHVVTHYRTPNRNRKERRSRHRIDGRAGQGERIVNHGVPSFGPPESRNKRKQVRPVLQCTHHGYPG